MNFSDGLKFITERRGEEVAKNKDIPPFFAEGYKILREALNHEGVFPALMFVAAAATVLGGEEISELFEGAQVEMLPLVKETFDLAKAKEAA